MVSVNLNFVFHLHHIVLIVSFFSGVSSQLSLSMYLSFCVFTLSLSGLSSNTSTRLEHYCATCVWITLVGFTLR